MKVQRQGTKVGTKRFSKIIYLSVFVKYLSCIQSYRRSQVFQGFEKDRARRKMRLSFACDHTRQLGPGRAGPEAGHQAGRGEKQSDAQAQPNPLGPLAKMKAQKCAGGDAHAPIA